MPSTSDSMCSKLVEYIFIKEASRTKSVNVCGGSKRERHVYLSVGPLVELTISTELQREHKGHFLLSYEGMMSFLA